MRLFRCGKKALKAVLQHEEGERREQHTPVEHAVIDREIGRADGVGDGSKKKKAHAAQHSAAHRERHDEHGEDLVCLFLLALAERFGDERAAARANHEAEGGERHDDGEDEVQRGEGILADKVRNEKAVDNAVNRGDDHHENAGRDKAQQLLIGEMIGKGNLHKKPPKPPVR